MSSKILVKTASSIGKRLSKYRGRPFGEALAASTRALYERLNNVNFDMRKNGELRVLKILAELQPKCVFDVGANIGDWCKLISELCPSCTVHAFEIVPSTYETLMENTKDLRNVVLNNVGLSDEEGVVRICMGHDSSTATACRIEGMRFHDDFYKQEFQCKTRKASGYLEDKAIENVDVLKVDVEGMDLRVIKGFGDRIENVRAVQFEYGVFNIASHDLLSDFCQFFKGHGFTVGKVFPRTVDFFEYHFNMENFHVSNYLAVRNDDKDLIARLTKFGK